MKQIYFAVFALFVSVGLSAQTTPTGEVEDVQVIIEKDKALTLPTASRIFERTQIKAIEEDTVVLTYIVSQPTYSFEAYQPTFRPATFKETASGQSFANYVKAGFGNYGSPLIEAYGNLAQRDNFIGVWLQHESFAKGPVRGNESSFSRNQFSVLGNYSTRYFDFKPILNYRREGFGYFGYDFAAAETDPTFGADHGTEAIFEHWSAGGVLSSVSKSDFQMSVSTSYEGTSMKYKDASTFNTDNRFKIGSDLTYAFSDNSDLNVGIGFHWAQYKSATYFTRSKTFLNPSYSFTKDQLSVKAGLKLVAGSDSSSQFYFYPDLSARYFLNDRMSVTAIADGDLEMNTLESLYNQNRYLADSLGMMNTNRPFGFKGIFAWQLNDRFIFEGFGGYDIIKNQPLFAYSVRDTSSFSARYDSNFGRFQMGAKASYLIESQTLISSSFTYFAYKEGTENEAWFLPLYRFELNAKHEFIEGLSAGLRFAFMGGMKAPLTNITNDPVMAKEYANEDTIFELGASVNYDIRDNIGVFLTAENILNKEYERYLNYPSRGATVKIGFIFRF